MTVGSYRDLDAWKLSMTLVEAIYDLTRSFPRDERFGLTAQLRRSAVGIPSHISEGHQHKRRAYRHYVSVALGAQAECETQLELARRLHFGEPKKLEDVCQLTARVGQVLHGLRRSLPDED